MDFYTECPLHWLVCTNDYYSHFQARLGDPNERDTMGLTLLHVAAQSPVDNSKTVRLLLDRGADVNSTTLHRHTPLHFAVSSRKLDMVVDLIEAKADVNAEDVLGRTALHLAVCKEESCLPCPVFDMDCDISVVERLLRHPEINVNPVDETGDTPLMWAVRERHSKAVGALLKKGANPNVSNKYRRTPLHEAFSAPNPVCGIVTSLLTNGACIYSADNSRRTPLDIFICKAQGENTYAFASLFVWLIALRYRIKDCLKHKLQQIPLLSCFLDKCCEEVSLMKKIVIYDNVTLHDFVLGCFQMNAEDPIREIYIPVVEVLLSDLFEVYFETILDCFSTSDLLKVLEITVGKSVSIEKSRLIIFIVIKHFYNEDKELKKRILKFQ